MTVGSLGQTDTTNYCKTHTAASLGHGSFLPYIIHLYEICINTDTAVYTIRLTAYPMLAILGYKYVQMLACQLYFSQYVQDALLRPS